MGSEKPDGRGDPNTDVTKTRTDTGDAMKPSQGVLAEGWWGWKDGLDTNVVSRAILRDGGQKMVWRYGFQFWQVRYVHMYILYARAHTDTYTQPHTDRQYLLLQS